MCSAVFFKPQAPTEQQRYAKQMKGKIETV